jgi:hypothetical protein
VLTVRWRAVIISHAKRFVILAPWKTASMTVHARLGHLSESPYSRWYELNPILRRVVHQHLIYADFAALPESRLGYFSAAFIRNPYDRVYSGFLQMHREFEITPLAPFSDDRLRPLVMRKLADNFARMAAAGYDFDAWVAGLDEGLIVEVGRNPSFPLHPVHYWTHYDGRQAVDFVGRVETFEADFAQLCAAIGVDGYDLVNENVSGEDSMAVGDARGYRYVDRMSPASHRRIESLFAEDFELFGYPRVDDAAA